MSNSTPEGYVPAAGRAWLTALYDPAIALTMRERSFRTALVAETLAQPTPRVALDLGCGTGSLAAQLAKANRALSVIGIDGDERVLAAARHKLAGYGDQVELIGGLADSLPVKNATVDAFVASLVLHHLARDAKLRALSEAMRVLKPGGRLVIADWGRPQDPAMRAAFLMLQLLDGFENTRDHAAGRLPAIITQAGFLSVDIRRRWRTVWGTLELTVAHAPATQ